MWWKKWARWEDTSKDAGGEMYWRGGVLVESRKNSQLGFELHKEICQFMEIKGKDCTVLQDEKWKCELVFLTDITAHLNTLNLQLHDRMITDMYDAMKAFHLKLLLWESQM